MHRITRVTRATRATRIAAAGLALLAGAGGVTRLTSAGAAPATRNLMVPKSGALLGTWIQTPDQKASTITNSYNSFESLIDRKLAIAHTFYDFTDVFPSYREPIHISAGRTVLVSWGGTRDTAGIISGHYDAMIRARAQGLKDLGVPVFLRYAWEADGDTNPVRPPSATSYVTAWRHVHDLFTNVGASNVVWVWTATAYGFVSGDAPNYYPGDAYTDWVGADGYNWAPLKKGAPWRSFEEIYSHFYAFGSARGKPMMAPEMGVLDDPKIPGRKGEWFTDALATLKRWPQFKALVYFNSVANSYDHPDARYPFVIQSSSQATAGFRKMGLDPYMNPKGGTNPPPSSTTTTAPGPTTTTRPGSTTTTTAPPTSSLQVTTWNVHDLASTTAQLTGNVKCASGSVTYWFTLWKGSQSTKTVSTTKACTGRWDWSTVDLTGLTPNTDYRYAISASQGSTTATGDTVTFRTS